MGELTDPRVVFPVKWQDIGVIGSGELDPYGNLNIRLQTPTGYELRRELIELAKVGLMEGLSISPIMTPVIPRREEKKVEIVVAEEDYIVRARDLVANEVIETYQLRDWALPEFKVCVVWSCKTLQNWKAVLCTDLDDQLMYELTYDGNKKTTYVDTYEKIKQTVVRDGD